MKVLVFDIWGQYAHFKKIYATTSAVSYVIPSKTALYGYAGAILGLQKFGNEYLNHFTPGQCAIALEIEKPIVMQRINTNLRAVLGRMKPNNNRKPTTIEYVHKPMYRIYFAHKNDELYQQLKQQLSQHLAVYTPSLGLANLISNFKYIGEFDANLVSENNVLIDSVIPRSAFIRFDIDASFENKNEIVEVSQYSLEMDIERNVTKRDDVFLDRKGEAIQAEVKHYHQLTIEGESKNIIFL